MAEFKHLILAHGHWPDSYESHQYDSHRNVFFNNDMEGPQNYHYLQMNGNQLVNHHSACNCVKLKYCSPTMEMARKMYTGFISDYINSQLQVIACDFIDNEMAVCCPNNKLNVNGNSVRFSKHRRTSNRQRHHRHRHESDEHKKWVWDIEEANSSEEKFSSTTQSYKTTIEYSNYPTQDTTSPPKSKTYNSTFFITHEDPKSKKNCPPPLSEEFELPKNHSFFKEPQPSTTQKSSTNIQSTTTSDNNLVPTESNSNTPIQTELQEKMKLINKKSCGLSFGSRIIGGEDAGFGRFSWMARLAYRNTTSGRITYRCAGSVIADKYVLTAGHCVSNLVDNLEITLIRLGDVNAELENECDENGICAQEEDFEIERIIVHPEYNNPRYANDIALIRLKQSTASSNRIGTICLPIGEYQDAATRSYDAGNGIVAGWGAGSRMNNAQNEMLQWIRLPFVNTTECAEFYSNYTSGYRLRIMISNSQLCYQGRENGDACAGDSGGPLMNEAELNNDKFVILGLVSFGPRLCGLSNFPGVYTRVSSYVEWILRNIEP
ncbi:CLUMA_CG004144, isoform A [Clunio marinus]|uniref:CLUMA_CG004144, isoform A n=1 Tax=Clunio marinus TaxID=568069 RepID=A0A1J1HSE4_9DIPT|nr:CLUMA_CG004144, isoform A [Clunio marinus]